MTVLASKIDPSATDKVVAAANASAVAVVLVA